MKVAINLNNYQSQERPVLAIGNFDGVHLGHQALLCFAKNIALELAVPLAVMTFEPHPALVMRKKEEYRILALRNKILRLEEAGVDLLFIQNFSHKFARLEAKDFIENILIKTLNISALVVGENFTFGHKRQGNIEMLKNYNQFQICSMPLGKINDLVYSSTIVREYLRQGELAKAKEILGYDYYITGKVIEGDKIGRKLGFPTANIKLSKHLLRLPYGVYVTRLYDDEGNDWPAVANLGVRPTLEGQSKELLEVYVLDKEVDLYNKRVVVEFYKFIRPEMKFDSLEELQKEIRQDINKTKNYYNYLYANQ